MDEAYGQELLKMARLLLKFESAVLKEIPLGTRPVTIGRAPDNEIAIDNLAVSNYHARVYAEAGKLVIEDLSSLNGTFVNDLRVERAVLRDGDTIQVGKHSIQLDAGHDAALPVNGWRKAPAPKVDETMVLDTHERREMLRQAAAAGERSQLSPARLRVPTLSVLSGRTDQAEYMLSGKLTVIGRSGMATVRLQGWFAPRVAAQINRREDGYYLGLGDRIPKVNGQTIAGATRLRDGDVIEIGRVRLHFAYRD
jgi:pSer/pThr/pTyr-binding forkhead associated (FHA) protein